MKREKAQAQVQVLEKKEMKEKQVETAQKMRKLDKQLTELNLDVIFLQFQIEPPIFYF